MRYFWGMKIGLLVTFALLLGACAGGGVKHTNVVEPQFMVMPDEEKLKQIGDITSVREHDSVLYVAGRHQTGQAAVKPYKNGFQGGLSCPPCFFLSENHPHQYPKNPPCRVFCPAVLLPNLYNRKKR